MTSGNGGVTFFTGVPLGGVTSGVVGCERSSARNVSNKSGQIIATSHDLTPNSGLVKEIPLFQGNQGW